MISKRHPNYPTSDNIELTDERKGAGLLRVEGVGRSRWVQDAARPGLATWYGHRGHYEHDEYRVVGRAVPDEYELSFGLKLYEDGNILPSSLAGATRFKTRAETFALIDQWLARGGPGLVLEDPEETKRRQRALRSAALLSKLSRSLSQLSDEDLVKLSESALRQITKREENVAKEAAKAAEKRRKAEEKAAKAAEKAAKAAEKAAAKAIKDAEKVQKAEERAKKAAEREAKKATAASMVAVS